MIWCCHSPQILRLYLSIAVSAFTWSREHLKNKEMSFRNITLGHKKDSDSLLGAHSSPISSQADGGAQPF